MSTQTKSSDSIQGETNNWRVLRQIAFNWCLHQASGDCLPGSSPLWDEGKRIHFALGEREINDPEMGLCEIRYEPCLRGLGWAQTDGWLAGVNFRREGRLAWRCKADPLLLSLQIYGGTWGTCRSAVAEWYKDVIDHSLNMIPLTFTTPVERSVDDIQFTIGTIDLPLKSFSIWWIRFFISVTAAAQLLLTKW